MLRRYRTSYCLVVQYGVVVKSRALLPLLVKEELTLPFEGPATQNKQDREAGRDQDTGAQGGAQ